ncbi:transporter substrate-binding domain-containing protein, partial [Pirellulales bacterium]|nr:transporter substrate-binding domain-containing protein [Pirellulales bacterium]
ASDTCRLRNLQSGKCDAVIGLPHESVLSPQIAWTTPYASGKFGLVVRGDQRGIRSLVELHGKRVGIVSGTTPVSRQDHRVVGFPSCEALLRGFEQSKLDGALVDVDFTAWYLKEHPQLKLRLVDEFVSNHRWSIGIAVREADRSLRDEISRAIDSSIQHASLRPLFARVGLVHRPPLVDAAVQPTVVKQETWQRIVAGDALVVSMDPANLPYSSADAEQPGFDVIIAQALAKQLGVDMRIEWIDVHSETAIGQLLDHESDLAFGAAVDPDAMDDEEEIAGKVIYSRPYYGTGYFLVARQAAEPVTSLADLKGEKSRRLGTQAGTIADYSLRQRGYLRRLFGTQLALLTSLEKGGIDYAYLWSNSGWLLHQSPEVNAKIVSGYVPEDRWNIAVAMRSGDVQLKKQVDRSLESIVRRGVVAEALREYHVPYLAPFEMAADANPASVEGVRHRAIDRGLEPKMSLRQRSQQSYDDLAKIRSRGTLVVGLDQNNLPYSTAHPQPAGVDLEISALLAEKLGVSLEVYWAYSSHDSYPSKLAKKRSCDVILGVMPDDRFADRVAYSEPYYFANYVYAVPADSNVTELENLPVAVEPGIAVRNLAGRKTERYPNLTAILSAVAKRKVPAGYVISGRAHWMAAEKWPEKIRFVQPKTTVDRFGICAAIRRHESDLKDALDQAFRELRESGQLEQVFAKWHIPVNE